MVLYSKMAVKNISESVYLGTCHKVGTPQEIAFRREIMDATELLINQAIKSTFSIANIFFKIMLSGSQREGLRLNGSDYDIMICFNYRVLWDFAKSQFCDIQKQGVILCDSSESLPGFTLLRLPLVETDCVLLSASIQIKGRLYISSSRFREIALSPGWTIHGPCANLRERFVECDSARCFYSDFWPPSATSWIDRCHLWPPLHVVNDIVSNGCHFVAIGHKLGNYPDVEWRISFSQAETRLVNSMNHTQFLTYGLLKLVLKEIINNGLREEDKLLCSYHVKTAVFWAIQQNVLSHWGSQNILACFWVCFKLLLKFVYDGVCPNFFIPLNNMFLCKIHGGTQTDLFKQLYTLYKKGISLLLHSPSIRSYIIDILCNPKTTVCTDEHTLISDGSFNKNLFHEVEGLSNVLIKADLLVCVKYLQIIEQFIGSPVTGYQKVWLQNISCKVFQDTAFMLHHAQKNTASNKSVYITDKIACHLLKLAAKFGFAYDLLYISMYYYKTLRFRKALLVLEMAKLVTNMLHFGQGNNAKTTRGQSLSSLFGNIIITRVSLHTKISYIDELIPEQEVAKSSLYIPTLVLLHMLEFLCSRHVDSVKAQESLDFLQTVVQHVHGGNFISWEILGICQQTAGNIQAALYSYQKALSQNEENNPSIQTVTIQRIQDLQNDR